MQFHQIRFYTLTKISFLNRIIIYLSNTLTAFPMQYLFGRNDHIG